LKSLLDEDDLELVDNELIKIENSVLQDISSGKFGKTFSKSFFGIRLADENIDKKFDREPSKVEKQLKRPSLQEGSLRV